MSLWDEYIVRRAIGCRIEGLLMLVASTIHAYWDYDTKLISSLFLCTLPCYVFLYGSFLQLIISMSDLL